MKMDSKKKDFVNIVKYFPVQTLFCQWIITIHLLTFNARGP